MPDDPNDGCCCKNPDCCGEGTSRREFLKLAGLAAAAAAMAGETLGETAPPPDLATLVPADKKLKAGWLASLTARGEPAVYRGEELKYIGMPIGGLCAGQLYLGGDGKLWHWDIFNEHVRTGAGHYANPMEPASPLEQGFAIRIRSDGKTQVRALDRTGFANVSFRGEYPIGYVEYRDPASPVTVSLEAFSPFVPLSAEESALPATIMSFTVKNTSAAKVEVELAGYLENAACLHTGQPGLGVRQNRSVPAEGWYFLECLAVPASPQEKPAPKRPDILFEDFEKDSYDGWTATGTAFGSGPVEINKIPDYQGNVGGKGKRVVNSHASAPGKSVTGKDSATGTLTSKPFTIERSHIAFLIGGGAQKDKTCMNLLVDDKVVLSATGKNNNKMEPGSFDVRKWAGKTAKLQIVDNEKGPWGNIGVDEIVFTDNAAAGPPVALAEQHDFGTMGLALLGPRGGNQGSASVPDGPRPASLFTHGGLASEGAAEKPFGQKLVGAIAKSLSLEPGKETTVTFVLTWHFPNQTLGPVKGSRGQRYAARFKSAAEVAEYVSKNFDTLARQTRLWHDTWYDSTLPRWLLDRTFLNTSILATSTCHWFADGRFYGWEGVGCCAGTCTHVWHYAHAPARLFPELERDLRERTDFGVAFDEKTGVVRFRAEGAGLAIDGQSGIILRSYREHLMSADDAFLRRNWPRIKRALECLIEHDENSDGIIEGAQHNTLDAEWYGPIAWLSGLYVAALRAGEEMAREVGDEEFALKARGLFEKGRKNILDRLWGGEYFINIPDPQHPEAINSGTGCHIDSCLGQSWAFQVGLGRVFDEEHSRKALQALWKYNFAPDVGPYRAAYKAGRWYAMPGEAGLLMCTFPRKDWDFEKACGKRGKMTFAGYFNECMNGFEYQVAGHMVWEGMVQEGLAITRAVHDRYHPSRRNPWNEVECGDHYARSMASYGIFLAACGYKYHGPSGHLGFEPRLGPEDFKAAFTAAEGWGTFTQKRDGRTQRATVDLKHGRLRLRTLEIVLPESGQPKNVAVRLGGQPAAAGHSLEGHHLTITLGAETVIEPGKALEVVVEW